jgi:hypothetical protein
MFTMVSIYNTGVAEASFLERKEAPSWQVLPYDMEKSKNFEKQQRRDFPWFRVFLNCVGKVNS